MATSVSLFWVTNMAVVMPCTWKYSVVIKLTRFYMSTIFFEWQIYKLLIFLIKRPKRLSRTNIFQFVWKVWQMRYGISIWLTWANLERLSSNVALSLVLNRQVTLNISMTEVWCYSSSAWLSADVCTTSGNIKTTCTWQDLKNVRSQTLHKRSQKSHAGLVMSL